MCRPRSPPRSPNLQASLVTPTAARRSSPAPRRCCCSPISTACGSPVPNRSAPARRGILAGWRQRWEGDGTDWSATLIRSRYEAINQLCADVIRRTREQGPSVSDRIDAVLVHSVWGWLFFGVIMAALFFSIFTLAEYPMNWIDAHMAALGGWVKGAMAAGDLRDLLTDGVIGGVGGIVVFLPQILILFFFVGLLESTGYMARAAFSWTAR
jgi:ferrous iron transport protein B